MPIDYTEYAFGGNSGTGNAPTSKGTSWVSYTFERPTVRTAQDGTHPFIVKTIKWKMCAAPSSKQKVYARVSYANGKPYDNTRTSTISWQKEAKVTYMFQGANFAFNDGAGGTNMRVWLVSGGAFYFDRNTGGPGHLVSSTGATFSGSPVGSILYAQVATPPLSVTAARDSTDSTKINVSWKAPTHAGGTAEGYMMEVAEDSGFSTKLRSYYPAIKSGAALRYVITGASISKTYYVRMCLRNEVSHYFKMKGGQWSTTVSVGTGTDTTVTPPEDTGTSGGTSTGVGATDSGGSTGSGSSSTDGQDSTSGTGTSSSTGTGDSTTTTTTDTPTVVYTPLPDVSSTNTAEGGLLLSHPTDTSDYAVYLYDRGGRQRLGQFVDLSQVTWDRRRDDISQAQITMSSTAAVGPNLSVLNRMGVMRSELVIFRGDQRVWEGPITFAAFHRQSVVIQAKDVFWYAARCRMQNAYSNAYPNLIYAVERAAGVMTAEMVRQETPVYAADGSVLVPPINVLPYLKTYVEDGDARTTVVTSAYSGYVWNHVDDLAHTGGIDYTVIGRAIHLWDTSRAALGRLRTVTAEDFLGDPYIGYYGSELATSYSVSDGTGGFGTVDADQTYYGAIEQLAAAYGTGGATAGTDSTAAPVSIPVADLVDQATRGITGRDPVPVALNVSANSQIDVSRPGLGFDVLVPGVFVPVNAVFSGRTFTQLQKLSTVSVTWSPTGEIVTVTMDPMAALGTSEIADLGDEGT